MTTVSIKKEQNQIVEITIKGHANYEEYGKDIVCAAISSIVITSVNAILRIDDNAISYEEKKDTIKIKVLKHIEIVNILIENMLAELNDLTKKYNKNIKIEEVS